MDEKALNSISDPTRLRILGYLAERPLTNTELYKKFRNITYRESIFKSLKKLKEAGLLKREFKEKRGYEYSLNFKEVKISNNLILKVNR